MPPIKINSQTDTASHSIKHGSQPSPCHASNYSGSTLIEVLVAMVILSTGMLAVLVMFTESIAALGNLVHQQRAIRLAANISETLTNLPHDLMLDPPIPAESECSSQPICTPGQWLAANLYSWQQLAQQQLPDGLVDIDTSDVSDEFMVQTNILITWSHRNGQRLSYALQLERV
jgi:type II secretory pathway pseudopilin PulG